MKHVGIISAVASLMVVAAVCASAYISNYNYGNEAEKGIVAQHTDNRNVLSSYMNKVRESSQIPAMYKEDLVDVVSAAIEGRYGEDGSQAAFQWLQEQNPSLDASVYKELQRLVVDGRDEFKNSQTILIDKVRAYETNLGYWWKGVWLSIAGYPKIDLEKYGTIVTNQATEDAFESGKDEGLTLR